MEELVHTGPQRRLIDPERNRLSLEAHAARALARFIGPDAENIETAQFTEGDRMRRAVKSLLFRLDLKIPPEIIELLGKLETQHPDLLKTLSFFDFLQEDGRPREGDVPPPSFEKIRQSFSLEELEAAIEFKEPTLLIIPEGVTFDDLIHTMNAHKTMANQVDAHVNENAFGKMVQRTNQEPLKITGYRACIVEGAREMPIKDGDDVQDTWRNRNAARKAFLRSGALTIKGMDRVKASLLMLHSYRTQKPVDQRTMTLLDDDSALSDSCVPCADLYDWDGRRQPRFDAGDPEDRPDRARFRSSVGGDVLLA